MSAQFPTKLPLRSAKPIPIRRSNTNWIYASDNSVSQRPTTSSSCTVPSGGQALNLSRDKVTATVAVGGLGAAVTREVGKIVESSLRELLGRGPTRHLPPPHQIPTSAQQHDVVLSSSQQDQRKVKKVFIVKIIHDLNYLDPVRVIK